MMKTSVAFWRVVVRTAHGAAIVLVLSACGGAKQTHVATATTPPLGRANAQPSALLPNTPTASSVAISEEVLRACNIPDSDAYFAFDSSRLTAFDYTPLDELATCFTRGPLAGRQLRLVGHTDPRGAPEYNMTLGQSRADAVALYVTTQGMNRAQATATSRGAMDATGHDETGWAHDRRVDVSLGN
jgi:peptidoglycan-associated lipoprotein